MSKIETMLPILRCPRTGTKLTLSGEKLMSESGEEYPVVNGKPILVREVERLHVTPPSPSIISKTVANFVPLRDVPPDGVVIHLGCGDVPSSDPRVISIDILPTDSADLVAEAEALPLVDASVDFLQCGAVFEHLYDPLRAVGEIRRILKEGGAYYIDTAFMQSYHGFPSHFFNLTPQAVETFLVDDFILEASAVPNSGSVSQAIRGLLPRLLGALPGETAAAIKKMTVEQFIAACTDSPEQPHPLFAALSAYSRRAMAASFVVVARKPADYHHRRAAAETRLGTDGWHRLKRTYYAARVEIMLRHHEIELYRRLARAAGDSGPPERTCPDLDHCLAQGRVGDTLDPDSWSAGLAALDQQAALLTDLRNHWIRRYLTCRDRPPPSS